MPRSRLGATLEKAQPPLPQHGIACPSNTRYPVAININIRPAQLADAPVIADFNARLADETEGLALDRERVLAGVTALLKDAGKGFYLVADAGGEVAGQLGITYEWSDWRNANFWWFQSVYVAAAFRGRGVFKQLFQHVHDQARSRGEVCGLRLYVEQENHRAREVYQKLGLHPAPYQMMEIDFVLSHSPARLP